MNMTYMWLQVHLRHSIEMEVMVTIIMHRVYEAFLFLSVETEIDM